MAVTVNVHTSSIESSANDTVPRCSRLNTYSNTKMPATLKHRTSDIKAITELWPFPLELIVDEEENWFSLLESKNMADHIKNLPITYQDQGATQLTKIHIENGS